MAAIDASKPVAKALEILRSVSLCDERDVPDDIQKVYDAISLLEEAIDKLCEESK